MPEVYKAWPAQPSSFNQMFQVRGMNMQEIRKIARRKTKAAATRSKLREARRVVFEESTVPASPSLDLEWAGDFVSASNLLREYHMFMPASAREDEYASIREEVILRFDSH